jgi:hypothetical protein
MIISYSNFNISTSIKKAASTIMTMSRNATANTSLYVSKFSPSLSKGIDRQINRKDFFLKKVRNNTGYLEY